MVYVISKGDKLANLPVEHPSIDKVVTIRAGKFRRYHGEGWKQLLDVLTILKNLRDFAYFIIGTFQSIKLLRAEKPDVIFIKGGFVGVPVGLAAAIFKVPYITHDSDAISGLANRIISKWAKLHTVAMPINEYKYDSTKTVQVGVPISKKFNLITENKLFEAKKKLGIDKSTKVILVTGGGNGSARINNTIVKISNKLFIRHPNTYILQFVGPGNKEKIENDYSKLKRDNSKNILVEEFATDFYKYSAASDIIITRAGASTLTEYASQGKVCIVIPNPNLTGGHQTKNARILDKVKAIKVIKDKAIAENPELLLKTIEDLLDNDKERKTLSENIYKTFITDSAKKLANLILDTGVENI